MKLRLTARRDGERVRAVSVACDRPLAARVLVGRAPAEVLRLAPALFSLCGGAQAAAAAVAFHAAGASEAADAVEVERALAAEMAREHLWRLLLDWPALFGLAMRRETFAGLHRRLLDAKDADAAFRTGWDILDFLAESLPDGALLQTPTGMAELVDLPDRGCGIGAVLARIVARGASETGLAPVPLLPALSAGEWAGALGGVPSPAFCRTPTWRGGPHETGALARHAESAPVRQLLDEGHRVAARLLARLLDLADCAHRLREPLAAGRPPLVDAAPLATGGGIARVETARGVLLHALRLEAGRVVDYAIVAPTEWNFHPAGAFVREATGLLAASRDAAALQLKALALALDPCVEYELVIEETAHA